MKGGGGGGGGLMVPTVKKSPCQIGLTLEAAEYKTRNQMQIFSTIKKCIEISEVTLTIHIAHPSITPWI